LIKSNLIKKYDYISHGFFNKIGGYSNGIYKSLNCGLGSKDKKKNVYKNLRKVCKKIGCNEKNLVLLNQVHSNKIHCIRKITKKKITGDSLVTSKKNIAIGILTADCAPILIFDPKKKIIAAIHAGWRGAYKRIIHKTIKSLKKKGSKTKDIVAIVGPSIAQKNYEIKKDFLKKFLKQNSKNIIFFRFVKKKIFFSLSRYIKYQLVNCGVKKIEVINKDTYSEKNNFFSSRRSLKNKNNDYGRNISLIMIK